MMNAGDYEQVAAVIAESPALSHLPPDRMRALVLDFADRFVATSERFDPVRFANTCNAGVFTDTDVMGWSHGLHLRVSALHSRRRN